MKSNQKITKYRRYPSLNIGTLLFSIVFIYLVIFVIIYLTQNHVTPYEVVRGSISGNYRFNALSLRTEEMINATQSGNIRYYSREGTKTSAGSAVCAIVNSSQVHQVSYDEFSPSEQELERLQNIMSTFSMNFSGNSFQKTYDFKAVVQGTLSEITKDFEDDYVSMQNRCYAPKSGFVIYNTDGFEQVSSENITMDMFDQNSYKINNLRDTKQVRAGDQIYKLITSESWKLYFPMDQKLVTELNGEKNIRFRFLKDNMDFSAPFRIIQNGGQAFGEISMDSSLVRYATERFLEIELILAKITGLKVPSSSIVDKQFYSIPDEYAIVNEDTPKEITVKVEHFRSDGSSETKYISANVYSHTDGKYLVNKALLSEGDNVLKEGSNKRLKLDTNDVMVLQGVYNINKGYAVFREVTIIDQNEEYCIVKANNIYGLAAYDYIVLNASEVDVDQIIN